MTIGSASGKAEKLLEGSGPSSVEERIELEALEVAAFGDEFGGAEFGLFAEAGE